MKSFTDSKRSLSCGTAFFLAILFLSGCASVSVQSVRDSSFSEPIHKLFVLVNHRQVDAIDAGFTPYLMGALKDEFSRKGVEVEIRMINPLALNEDIQISEIMSYKPDGVMTIVANGGVVGAYGGMAKILYDVSIFDPQRNKRIWRAQIDASGGTAVREKRMQMMVQNLIQRLSDDRIISSEPRKIENKL